MSPTSVEQRRHPGRPCSELAELIAAAGLVPERAGDTQANALLEHDGAVILTGRTDEAVELVAAAAAILGTRLRRRLFPIRRQAADGAERGSCTSTAPTSSSTSTAAQCACATRTRSTSSCSVRPRRPAAATPSSSTGTGCSTRCAPATPTCTPSSVDVDYFGGWTDPSRGVPHTPLVRRLVEHTRAGRLVVRASATPVPREQLAEEHALMLQAYAELLASLTSCAPCFRL